MIISFCVNAVVEPPALHVVFNSTAGMSRREFMEVFVPDETGHPGSAGGSTWRALFAFGQAAFASPEAPRFFRALAQYQAALGTGTPDRGCWCWRICISRARYLTKAVQRVNQARLGLTERACAASRGGHQPEELADDGRELRAAGVHLRGRQADLRHCPQGQRRLRAWHRPTSAASGRLPMM